MNKITITSLIAILVSISLALAIAAAAGSHGVRIFGVSVFALCAMAAFLINWLAFIPANAAKTEHYYDLTGSLTYLSLIGLAATLSSPLDLRATLMVALVGIWALRLGSFLFSRIKRDGKDDRFDEIKPNSMRFFVAWTLQALWVVITSACAITVITSEIRVPIGWFAYIGCAIWVFGFAVEVIADRQKTRFKQNAANRGRFISTGLWSWSRHPNYFGEMVLWSGVAIIALPVLAGWQWLTLISPIFVYVLIRYISGVNKLEEKADAKWGNDSAYQEYRSKVPLLVLLPPRLFN